MDSSQRDGSIHDNPISQAFLWPVHLVLRLTFLVLALLLLTWCIYLVFMHKVWEPGTAVEHTRLILASDLGQLTQTGSNPETAQIAIATANRLYWLVWELTRIHEAMIAFADPTPRGMLDTYLRNVLIVPFAAEIYVLMDATKIFGERLALFITAWPVFGLAYVVGTVDGLVQRYIRRSGAGRESSGLYHRAKFLQLGGAAFLTLGYACIPMTIDPRWVILPSAAILAVLARIQWTYYKKYL